MYSKRVLKIYNKIKWSYDNIVYTNLGIITKYELVFKINTNSLNIMPPSQFFAQDYPRDLIPGFDDCRSANGF